MARLRVVTLVMGLIFILFSAGTGIAGTETAQVPEDQWPWSGDWWSVRMGKLVNGYSAQDHAAPLEKYDACVSGCYPGPATIAATPIVYDPDAKLWIGFCDAWAAAAILEPEPSEEGDLNGVRFRVGDKKGLLTLHYYRNYQSVMFGNRYNSSSDDPDDIYPLDFHQTLRAYILSDGLPVVMDIEPEEPVWNYPAYKYEMEWTDTDGFRDVTCTVWFANDSVPSPDVVGTVAFTRTYTYRLEIDGTGALKDAPGQWLGESADYHPDFMWFPEIFLDQEILLERDRLAAILTSTPDDASEDLFEENDTLDASFSIQTPVPDRYYIGRLHDADWFRINVHEGDSFLAYVTDQAPADLGIDLDDAAGAPLGDAFYHMNYLDKAPFTGHVFVNINSVFSGATYNIEFSQWPITLLSHVAPPNWQTELTLFNPGEDVNRLRKNLFAGENHLTSESLLDIGPGSILRVPAIDNTETFVPGASHYMRLVNTLETGVPVAPAPIASASYQIKGRRVDLPLPAADMSEQTTLYIPHLELAGGWWNGLALQNLDAGESVAADFRFYNANGVRLLEARVDIPAGEARSALIGDYFSETIPSATAWIEIAADRPVSGFILWGNSADPNDSGLCGMPLPSPAHTSQTLYVPHLAVTSGWWTGVGLINPNDVGISVTFEGYSTAGQKLCAEIRPISGHGRWCDLIQNAFSEWNDGVAWVKITAAKPMAGFQMFGRKKAKLAALALKTPKDLATDLILVLPDTDSLWSGFALLNPGDQSTKITAVPYDKDGSRLIPADKVLDGGLFMKNAGRVDLTGQFFAPDLPADTAYLTIHAVNPETAIAGMGLYEASGTGGMDQLMVRVLGD